jgi:6-phosphogluconolactonase (cycloisomerase 2 family)
MFFPEFSANETDRVGENKEGTVSAFAIDRNDGQLRLLNTVPSGGAGPTYVSVHPSGRFLLVANYFGGSVVVLFDYDADKGRLIARQTLSTLPPGFAGSNFCSEIMVSPDGRFLYAGNRLHDSIGIFAIGDEGLLTYVGEEWTRGNYPRSFNFNPSGRFLYCCNQRADNVTVFRVDRDKGTLTFTNHYIPVGNPSIIVFLDLARTWR